MARSKRKVAVERVTAQKGRRKLPHEPLAELGFTEEGLELPGVLDIAWGKVAVADVKVRDHGQRLQLSIASGDHSAFDFLRLEMPMSPEAAELLQVLRSKGPRLAELPGPLLCWPCSELYGRVCKLTEALLIYEVVNTTLEMLFGFMLLTSLGRIFKSSGGGMLKSLQKLGTDVSDLFSQDAHVHNAPLELIKPYVGEESMVLGVVERGLAFVLRTVLPARVLVYCAWHVTDLASDFLLVLLLLQHLLTAGYFLSRIYSTLRAVFRFAMKAVNLARRGLGVGPPASSAKRD